MGLRASRLRWPEWTIGAGGLVLLAAMLLLPWYQVTRSSPPPPPIYYVTDQIDGWHGLTVGHWLFLITALVALATALFQAQRRAPAIPVTLTAFATILGGVSVLWLIARVLIDPPGGRGIGGWIGLLGAAAITYGGIASLRLEGIARADAPPEIPIIHLAGEPSG
jgi:hypothetical protein